MPNSARWVGVISTTTSSKQIITAQDPTGTWTQSGTTQLGTSQGAGVAFAKGLWVVGGAAGKVVYTNAPTGNWTANTSSGFSASTNVWGVAASDANWVGAGGVVSGTAMMRYAADPTGAWTQATTYTSDIYNVQYLNGTFVASIAGTPYASYSTNASSWSNVGGSGLRAATNFVAATDGTTWMFGGVAASGNYASYNTSLSSGTWTNISAGFTTGQIRSLCYANGYWVAGGLGGIMRYATSPGGTWSTPTSVGFSSNIMCILYADGLWVASGVTSGNVADIRCTTDPTGTWTQATSIPAVSGAVEELAYGGGSRQVVNIRQAVNRAATY